MVKQFGRTNVRDSGPLAERVPDTLRRRWLSVLLGTALCFSLRVSLWPFGLLEEFGLSLAYSQRGLKGFTDILPTFSGRPLALVPSYIGLYISNGGFAGQYAVAGLISACQFMSVLWAFSPLIRDYRLRWGLAFLVASNPLWPAGFLLRYQPAQLSALLFLIWVGFDIRAIDEDRRRTNWLFGGIALVLCLLSYPALAVVPFLLIVPICIYGSHRLGKRPSNQRLIAVFSSTLIAITTSLIYTAKISPSIWPTAYEGGAAVPKLSDIGTLISKSQRTLLASRPFLSVFAIGAFLLLIPVIDRSNNVRLLTMRSSIMTFLIWCCIPLVALPYSSFRLHLGDQDRILFPTTLAMFLFIGILLDFWNSDRLASLFLFGIFLLAFAMSVNSVGTWRREGKLNSVLIAQVVGAVESGGTSSGYVVVDHSGRFGDVYTMLPPYLQIAVTNIVPETRSVLLCTARGVPKKHPVAARFPIATTEECDDGLLRGADRRWDFLGTPTNVEIYRLKT